ncbi:FAD-dependent monooxygenase [Streptomyces sp. NPDC046261]|uniref:FAD-dependent monooxygenase n=1 Tax=Streptomyces sp. NPDC046261 TaxID=3157200 RepID=UPI0033D8B1B8
MAVVGAGIGGLAAAFALLRGGADVTVYEQAPALGEAGVGMHLGPNGARILRRWGLEARLRRTAVRPEALEVRDGLDGRVHARRPMGDTWEEEYGAPHLTVERTDLHTALAARIPRERIVLGARLVSFDAHGDGVRLRCADGRTADADLLVGADGVHSVVRRAVAGEERPAFAGLSAVRGMVSAAALPRLSPDTVYVWVGREARLLCYPVAAGRRFTFVAVMPEASARPESWEAAGERDVLVRGFAGWHEDVRAVVGAAGATGCWTLYDREPLTRWGEGRFTLLGDAAHPMLPHHGQGVGQALEDAVALAHFLDKGPRGLRRYAAFRIPHVTRVQLGSRGGGSMRLSTAAAPRKPAAGGLARLVEDVSWIHRYDIEAALTAQTYSVRSMA